MSGQPGWAQDGATGLPGLGALPSAQAPGGSLGYVCKVKVTRAKPHVHQLCTPSAFWGQDTDDSPDRDGRRVALGPTWSPSEEARLSPWEGAMLGSDLWGRPALLRAPIQQERREA